MVGRIDYASDGGVAVTKDKLRMVPHILPIYKIIQGGLMCVSVCVRTFRDSLNVVEFSHRPG